MVKNMSQRVNVININLIIADQWTESHIPVKDPSDLNGVKYLNSHAQVLDITGVLYYLWFLAQDYTSRTIDGILYITYAQTVNSNGKYQNRYQRGNT
jgi:hypothetical protein